MVESGFEFAAEAFKTPEFLAVGQGSVHNFTALDKAGAAFFNNIFNISGSFKITPVLEVDFSDDRAFRQLSHENTFLPQKKGN